MDRKALILKEIESIFRKELEDESLQLTNESSAHSVEKWDSITNLSLISAIEGKFNIIFPIDFIFNAGNIGDFCDYISAHAPIVN
jgi:acyl carrier protein